MKNLFKYILLLLFLGTQSSLSAQEQVQKFPVLKFKPADVEQMPDSVMLIFRKGTLPSVAATEAICLTKPNSAGVYVFSPSFEQPIYMVQLCFYYNNKKRKQVAFEEYYFEPSDNIDFTFTKMTSAKSETAGVLPMVRLDYSGSRSTKFKVTQLLRQINGDLFKQENDHLTKEFNKNFKILDSLDYVNSEKFKEYLKTFIANVDFAHQRSQDTLKKYSSLLGNNITKFLSYELSPSFDAFPTFTDFLFQKAQKQESRQVLIDFYFANKQKFDLEPSDELAVFSKQFKDNKLMQVIYECDFKTKEPGFPFLLQYDQIKLVKHGPLRDALITLFLHQPHFQKRVTDKSTQDSCITDALKIVKSPELRVALNNQLLFFRGSQVPNFSFYDQNGNVTSIQNLKGKVAIIDFCFMGCKGCAQFSAWFKEEVHPKFVADTNFKVLSVNVDSKREYWIKAIESGLYNDKSYINLSIGPLNFNHPFLEHYKIKGFPFAILVDKNGKLISRITAQSSLEVREMIREALNQQVSK